MTDVRALSEAKAAPALEPEDAESELEPGAPPTGALGWRALVLRPEMGLPFIALLLGIYLSLSSHYFFQLQNFLNVTNAIAIDGIAAAFATIVIVGGGIDLTPVAVMTLVGIVCQRALGMGLPLPMVLVFALTAAVAVGLINGTLISVVRLNPFMVTLGTNFVFTGMGYILTSGQSLIISDQNFLKIGQSNLVGNVPLPSVIMLVSFTAAFLLLRFTRMGVYVLAVGGGENAARLSSVPVTRTKVLLYVMSALTAGVAGVVLASSSGAVAPFAASNAVDLLTIIAAVIIGGTALSGGRGSVVGTLFGMLLIGMIANGLVLNNISSFFQPVVTGSILLIAIILDELRRRFEAIR